MRTDRLLKYVRAVQRRRTAPHGQSLVELAFVFPILLLMLAGLIEVGYYVNNYLIILDASREAARHAADLNPRVPFIDNFDRTAFPAECGGPVGSVNGPDSDTCLQVGCAETTYLYHKAACLVGANMHPLEMDLRNPNVDVVVTIVAIINDGGNLVITERLPPVNGACTPDTDTPYFNGTCTTTSCCQGECYWSYSNYVYEGTALAGIGQASRFACADITDILNETTVRTDRQNGFVIVEAFYEHHQLLNLPVISQIVPDPIVVRAYSIMPVSAAEPTPTPVP